jgi:hypothetical protein
MNYTLKDGKYLSDLQQLGDVVERLQDQLSPKFLLFALVHEWTSHSSPSGGGRYCHLAVVNPFERLVDDPCGRESGWTNVGTLADAPPEICGRLKSKFPEYFLGDTYEFGTKYWLVGFFDGHPAGLQVTVPKTHYKLAATVRDGLSEQVAEEWKLLLGRDGSPFATYVQVLPLSSERGGARSAA